MNQSKFVVIPCNLLKAREKSRVRGAIGFGFASSWLKNWRETFKPFTKRSNRNHVITFDGHLKTALLKVNMWFKKKKKRKKGDNVFRKGARVHFTEKHTFRFAEVLARVSQSLISANQR